MRRLVAIFFLGSILLSAFNTIKLYLKDGTFQLARDYKVQGGRVSYLSSERGEWEDIPLALVDLEKTKAVIKEHEEAIHEEAAVADAEDKAEREARREIERVPKAEGAYLVDDDKIVTMKLAESKVVTNKKRRALVLMSPVPLVPGKATLELDGPQAALHTSSAPEFYIRLSSEERFGIVRMTPGKKNRIVENITTIPVAKESMEEPIIIETFRKQVGDLAYKLWPTKPLDPGEYGVVEYTEGKVNMQVWDFSVLAVPQK